MTVWLHRRTRRVAAVLAVLALAGVLTACGDDDATTTTAAATTTAATTTPTGEYEYYAEPVAELVALLPDSIKERGVLKVASMDASIPLSYVDTDGTVKGMDVDFARALAEMFGLEHEHSAAPFDALLPGLEAGRYDLVQGEFYIRAERLEVADFVTDWSTFSAFATKSDSPLEPQAPIDLCGLKVGVMSGSAEQAQIVPVQEACAAAGLGEIEVQAFSQQAQSFLALDSGRVDVVVTGVELMVAAIDQGQAIKYSGKFAGGPTAIAVARTEDSAQMLAAVQAGFAYMIETGVYAQILEKWGTSFGAITAPEIYTENSTPPNYDPEL